MNPGTPAARPVRTAPALRYAPVAQTVGQSPSRPARSNARQPNPNAIGKAIRIGWSGCPLIWALLRTVGLRDWAARLGQRRRLADRGIERRLRLRRLGRRGRGIGM